MITKNKLSGQPNIRPKEQFKANNSRSSHSVNPTEKKSLRFLLLLIAIMLLVTGATFAVIAMMRGRINTDAPADEIPAIDDGTTEKKTEKNTKNSTEEPVDDNIIETVTVPITETNTETPVESTAGALNEN